MFETVDGSLPFLFENLGLRRVMANYIPGNIRSSALLERLGFEREGYAREYLKIGGKWQDHVLTALLKPNWQQRREVKG